MKPVEVPIIRLEHSEGLPLPAYATEHSSGLDIPAAVTDDVALRPGTRALIPSGFILGLPHSFEAQIRPRSGMALKHGVTVLNAPGTIDADYRGEIHVLLINLGEKLFTVSRGQRVAQLVISEVVRVNVKTAPALEPTARGKGGFGSTGKDSFGMN